VIIASAQNLGIMTQAVLERLAKNIPLKSRNRSDCKCAVDEGLQMGSLFHTLKLEMPVLKSWMQIRIRLGTEEEARE
jgi:hypothetical protein